MWERPFGRDSLHIAAKRPLLQPLLMLVFQSRRSSPSTGRSRASLRFAAFGHPAQHSLDWGRSRAAVRARSAFLSARRVRRAPGRGEERREPHAVRRATGCAFFCLLFFAQAKKSRPPAAREPHLGFSGHRRRRFHYPITLAPLTEGEGQECRGEGAAPATSPTPNPHPNTPCSHHCRACGRSRYTQ